MKNKEEVKKGQVYKYYSTGKEYQIVDLAYTASGILLDDDNPKCDWVVLRCLETGRIMVEALENISTIITIGDNKVERFELNNLELYKHITFDELVQHGRDNGANIVNNIPWSWKINGKAITHENDDKYLIETKSGMKDFKRGDKLSAVQGGLIIFPFNPYETHSPGGCPM